MLTSGCRTGIELTHLWDTLQLEAREMCQFLGEELEGPLAVPVEGAGEGSVTGATRQLATTYLEDRRLQVLRKALELYPDQSARPS